MNNPSVHYKNLQRVIKSYGHEIWSVPFVVKWWKQHKKVFKVTTKVSPKVVNFLMGVLVIHVAINLSF